jgi:hypothetical protein
MRTEFGTIPLMTLLAASLTAGSGCSDLSAGRPAAPKGAPKLVRALVQDYRFIGGAPVQRGAASDLLDTEAPVACAVDNPCVTQFLLALSTPDLTCSAPTGGVCPDPLKAPSTGVQLSGNSTGIRLVFNKQLDPNSVETTMVDANGAQLPGQTNSLKPGIVEVLGPDGAPIDGMTAFWDNEGSPTFTSDVIFVPFGPAIVINPLPFNAKTTYTIRLHPALLKDLAGEAATNADGTPLADPTDFTFTTEDLTDNPGLWSADFTSDPTITPNDIVQLSYWEGIDETTIHLTATVPAGADAAAIEAYSDRGSSPVADDCAGALDPLTLDFVYTSGAGAARAPIDWPPGDYTLSFTATAVGGTSTYTSPSLTFTVAGSDSDPDKDPNASAAHVTPEQCL